MVIHGLLSCLIFRRENVVIGACLFMTLLNCLKKDADSSSTLWVFFQMIQKHRMMSFQSIPDRSLLSRSVENCEKLRVLIVLFTTLSFADVKIQNCEKWSETSVIMFPLLRTCSGLLTKILSISEAEVLCTRVGLEEITA